MKRATIEARIKYMQTQLSAARHPLDIKACNVTLERLIMLDADDDQEQESTQDERKAGTT